MKLTTKTKKITLIAYISAAIILETLFMFSEDFGINISSDIKIYFNPLILALLISSLIIAILLKTKKEIIEVEVIKEKIIYQDNEKHENKDNETNNKNKINNIIDELLTKQKTLTTEQFISEICKNFGYGQAIAYTKNINVFEPIAKYAYFADDEPSSFEEGNGLLGQTVKNKKQFILNDIPDGYTEIISGLGKGKPKEILMQPIIKNNKVTGIIEFANFKKFSDIEKTVLNEIGNKINKLN